MNNDDDVLSAAKKLVADAKKGIMFELSQTLINEHSFVTMPGKKVDTIYQFKDGYYQNTGEVLIKQKVEASMQKNATISTVNEVISRIKRLTFVQEDYFNATPDIINLANGMFDIKNQKLLPHDKEKRFTYILPVEYHPEQDCPGIRKFLSEVLEEDDVKLLQEYIGYCLYKRYTFKKALIFVGEKDTGKTTVLNLMIKFLGEANISGESLQKIAHGRFNAMNLKNKSANIYDDLPYQDISNAGDFKIATGGGYITAEEKFGETHQFINSAKLIYACNQIPKLKDSSDYAYFDRWIVIRFNKVVEKKDPYIIDNITSKEELSGLLNWSLEGLKRLFDNTGFTYNVTPEQNKLIILRNSEPLAAFIEDCVITVDNEYIPKELLYELYRYHAKLNKLPIMSQNMLTQKLPTMIPGMSTGQRNVKNRKVECYVHVVGKDYQWFSNTHGNNSRFYDIVYIKTTDTTYLKCSICNERERMSVDNNVCQYCFDNMPEKPPVGVTQERLED